ncbi:small integral membrane protein 47 [Gorilla gorilla gorilla]|uniref:small integral membrane protein 47 n=1 Tax=Gorilla gorilla gorilla TaxID=9595 RepID=UPI0024456BDF|nr:small integral membrane protein 47 [Gorilla gorilla gorilla]
MSQTPHVAGHTRVCLCPMPLPVPSTRMPFPRCHGHHSGLSDNPLSGFQWLLPSLAQRPRKEREDQARGGWSPKAMNFQENVTLAMALFTILTSIYFFNKAQQ